GTPGSPATLTAPVTVRTARASASVAAPASPAALAPPARPPGAGPPLPPLGGLALDLRVVAEPQPDPAALPVDLDHRDVELVARLEHVLDRRHALAGANVGDVQQPVGPLRQLDEGAERGGLDDLALESVA